MRITALGQAGLFVETKYGSVLCDPWFNPAYFASWFPFPSNERIDRAALANPTFLYVSHQHRDHFDPDFLREYVSKEATVLLPDYPLDLLERELRKIGFTKFIQAKNYEPFEVNGLRFIIAASVAPTDGPLGDSGIVIDDGETRIYDQNDSRPVDLDALIGFGPYDAHLLQFSGAIWYPMVYLYPQKMMEALGRKKRENEMARALRYAREIGATYVVPSAGPPCFLDDGLFEFNDFDRDPSNVFPDQTVFLEYLAERGHPGGRLMVPGSVGELAPGSFTVTHPFPDDEVRAIFADKRTYLRRYRTRKWPLIQEEHARWPRGQVDIIPRLKEWFDPLLAQADMICAGINDIVLLDLHDQQIAID
ncbi:MAG: MBL fold metallo-hydrolase, partial [Chloroflexota bacterium]|nr:MBL fold metallo-hydrolase [Chloroflexota bacterium]